MKAKVVGFIALAAVLFYFPLFLKLDFLPFRVWDEARPAVQAYEMVQSSNYLVTTFEGKPDLWYTKPPLQVWLQVVCIQVFGYGELAIRLPSALAALGTCILLLWFLHRTTRSWWFGLMAGVVLVTTAGFVSVHGSRTGDVDVLLTFFLTLAAFSFYLYAEEEKPNPQFLFVFFLGLAGAVLTKGVAGLFLLPAFFVFSLFRKNTRTLIAKWHFYGALLLFLVFVGGFYGLREWAGPGYLKAVWENELLGRYGQTLEGHKHGFFYYLERVVGFNAPLWVYLFPVGLLVGLFNRDVKLKRLTRYMLLLIGQYLLLISLSETKPYWYDIPLYPFWAVVVATGIYTGFCIVRDRLGHRRELKFVTYLLLIGVFFEPYWATFHRVGRNGEPDNWNKPYYALPNYLRLVNDGYKPSLDGWSIAYNEYYGHLLPYMYQLAAKGQSVTLFPPEDIQPGQQIITNLLPVQNYIDSAFAYTVVDTFENVKLYRIDASL